MLLKGACHCAAVSKERQKPPSLPIHALKKARFAARLRVLAAMPLTSLATTQRVEVEGEENITIHRAKIQNPEDPEPYQSEGERR